jgi:hypothetical protein
MFESRILPFQMEVGERMKSSDVIVAMPTRFQENLTSELSDALCLELKISLADFSFTMDSRIAKSAQVKQLVPAFYTALRLCEAPIAKVYFFHEENLIHPTQQVSDLGAQDGGVIHAFYAEQAWKVIDIADEIARGKGSIDDVPDHDIVHIKVKQTEVGEG